MILPLLLLAAQAVTPPLGLARADTNRDGVITRAEATATADARFARFDADRNGSVTAEERRSARREMRQMRRNRPITAVEFQQRAQARFARLDVDRNGVLTGEERGHPRRGRHGGGHGRDGMHRQGKHEGGGSGGLAITAAQFRTRALARFDRIDANRDGRIDRAELAARRAAPARPAA